MASRNATITRRRFFIPRRPPTSSPKITVPTLRGAPPAGKGRPRRGGKKAALNPATARPISAICRIMNDPVASIAGLAQEELTASVQALVLPKGLYVFSVKSADPERIAELG